MKNWRVFLFGKGRAGREHELPTPESVVLQPAVQTETADPQRSLDEIFSVVEVSNAEFFVGALFRRRFGCDSFPETPRHFVAFFRQRDGSQLALGYVHFEMWQQQALCGGLVIDERAWRHLPTAERALLRQQGGVAELMLRASFDMLPQNLMAIWGYVGDKQAEKVDLRVGFRHTGADKIMVIWRNDPGEQEKQRWLQKIIDLGPF
ncbi:MAG: hypothetical protein GX665_09735 [Gammaproteobacteria bacterium]|nr:hypothetical protein [Gammaproteobacteria bacterium]